MGSHRRDGAGAARRAPRRFGDESGLTLIEMMVTFSLLAVMLAATAGTLIVFTRTAAENERRVQATAILNEVQEEMHAAPWEVLGVYENELEPLDVFDEYVAGTPDTFDGDELVELLSWDDGSCGWTTFDEALACGREPGAPRTEVSVDRDGHEYTVRNAVAWIDRSGDGVGDVKRMTSVATWEMLGRTYEERFVSERAPTNIEAGDPQKPRLIQFDLAPRNATLTEQHQLPQDVEVRVRFTAGVAAAQVRFYVVDSIETELDAEGDVIVTGVTLREERLALDAMITDPMDTTKHLSFSGTIPGGGFQFTDGPRKVRAVGMDGIDEEYEGSRTLELRGDLPHQPDPGDDSPPPDDGSDVTDPSLLAITSAPPPTQSNVTLANSKGSRLFCQDLTIMVTVDGLNPEDTSSVTMNYSVGSDQVTNRPLNPPVAGVTGDNDQFSYTFEVGKDHGFRKDDQTTFDVHVQRVSGGEVSEFGDQVVSFSNASGSGC